jgi:hypothetical protein
MDLRMSQLGSFATTMESVQIVVDMLRDGLIDLSQLEVDDHSQHVTQFHASFVKSITEKLNLWNISHPVHQCWVRQGSIIHSPFHPDEYALELITLACITLVGQQRILQPA